MTRIQLSDAQAVILSTACARGDGTVFPVTTGLKGGAVGNVCKSLLKRGLIEEVAATDLEHGLAARRGTRPDHPARHAAGLQHPRDHRGSGRTSGWPAGARTREPARRRTGTKQEALIAMLRAEGGATIDEIVAALDWQPHTARGAISGALKKKLGLEVTSEKVEGRGRVYSLTAA